VLSALHGKVKQEKRLQIFMDFCTRKEAVLFATDVAGRGLDFPEVDWVLQLDCPEDVPAYIHRVGRTARNESKGKSLVLLTGQPPLSSLPILRYFMCPHTTTYVSAYSYICACQSLLKSLG
jgi:superfamily II DNA/RNA helicase